MSTKSMLAQQLLYWYAWENLRHIVGVHVYDEEVNPDPDPVVVIEKDPDYDKFVYKLTNEGAMSLVDHVAEFTGKPATPDVEEMLKNLGVERFTQKEIEWLVRRWFNKPGVNNAMYDHLMDKFGPKVE